MQLPDCSIIAGTAGSAALHGVAHLELVLLEHAQSLLPGHHRPLVRRLLLHQLRQLATEDLRPQTAGTAASSRQHTQLVQAAPETHIMRPILVAARQSFCPQP